MNLIQLYFKQCKLSMHLMPMTSLQVCSPWDNISNGIMIGILWLVEYERNHSSTHKDIRFER